MSGFVASVFAGLLSLSALVFDGARLIAERAMLDDHAANAARSAAQEVIDIRLGDERIDPVAGTAAAHRYLARYELLGHVAIEGLTVRVTLVRTVPMTLLTLIGIGERTITTTREVQVVDQ